jgi:hypothetical protein
MPHANELFDPAAAASFPTPLDDLHRVPSYRLELPATPFPVATQVCILPAPPFDLPQGEAFERGVFYRSVTSTVSILRETTVVAGGDATLILRLRDHDAMLLASAVQAPERLRVFRKRLDNERGDLLDLPPGSIRIADIGGAPAVAFPIGYFGTYVVVLEQPRENGPGRTPCVPGG